MLGETRMALTGVPQASAATPRACLTHQPRDAMQTGAVLSLSQNSPAAKMP
tara:strand:+ start:334 stop:486 length:153 start_codon:yes stop_codon:yes gene_type:complete